MAALGDGTIMSNEYVQERLDKLQRIRDLGFDPYSRDPNLASSILANNKLSDLCYERARQEDGGYIRQPNFALKEDKQVRHGQGRIVLRRVMGNLHFLTVRDDTGDMQVAIGKKAVDDSIWALAKLLDLGDIIQFEGHVAPTDKGEPTLWASVISVSCKSLVTPPEKHTGLVDPELRYRQRYVDLVNPDVMRQMRVRSDIIQSIRRYLGFLRFTEVETPILQTNPGGAIANPFATHHKALDIPMYMRIAPELYLKRLLVGGMSKVFEIGRNFRNEGVSTRHNPEFTSLELYDAYSSMDGMANLAMSIVENAIPCGQDFVAKWRSRPWRTVKMMDLVQEWIDSRYYEKSDNMFPDLSPEEAHSIYESQIESTLTDPTFVTHFPASKVPLAADDGNGFALNWELVIDGMEIGCGYTEQTDPVKQLVAFEKQGTPIDQDFIHALKVGMPPAGGMGIGIDRLVMVLTEAASVKDVILFPTMRPETTVAVTALPPWAPDSFPR
jgi:lysyl-tRNA synthetase class 2